MKSNALDYGAVTSRQRDTWATGDFNVIALQTMSVAENLVHDVDPRPGHRVLDVACGSGNAALAAARRYCDVIGIDYVPALVARAQARSDTDGSGARFQVADAQSLPFTAGGFDVVVSVFGVMFAPDQEKAAAELLRVCKSGGIMALASWTPEHWGGEFFRAHTKYVPPPEGLKPSSRWGTEAGLRELLGAGAELMSTRKKTRFFFRTVEHGVEVFAKYFGPTARALAAIDASAQRALKEDLAALFRKYNVADDGSLTLEAEYLDTRARRR